MAFANRTAATARMFNERRAGERDRATKNALIRFDHGSGSVECIVRNQSARGAKLMILGATSVPRQFQLKLDTDREWRNVTVRWRRGSEMGVSFNR